MDERKDHRYSLLSRFISLVFLIFINFTFFITWKIQNIHRKSTEAILSEIALTIQHNVESNINFTKDKLEILAYIIKNQITEINHNNILNLLDMLASKHTEHKKHFPIILHYKDNIFVKENSHYIEFSINHESLKNINNFDQKQFSLHGIDDILINKVPREKTLLFTTAIEIIDKNNKHVGKLISGIYLSNLEESIKELVNNRDSKIYYACINTTTKNILFNSHNFNDKDYSKVFTDLSDTKKDQVNKVSNLLNKERDYIIVKILDYPITLLIGKKSAKFSFKEYLDNLVPYKYELVFIFGMISILVYLFYNSILSPFLNFSNIALEVLKGEATDVKFPKIHSKEGAIIAAVLKKVQALLQNEKNLAKELSQTKNLLSLTNLRLEKEVNERTKTLEKILAEKDHFLNYLSHEIKIPLQLVANISENLCNSWQEFSEEKRIEISNQIFHSTQSLLTLFDNVLDFSKLSENKIMLKLESIDIVFLTQEIISEYKILYETNKSLIIKLLNEKPLFIVADKGRLKQVIKNLVINAIKFSPYNGFIAINIILSKITTDAGLRSDAIQFSIHDQGVGIPEDELSSIFSPFAQGSNIKNFSIGSGLGLAICRDIIALHNGKMWAENNKDGGATFYFLIPTFQADFLKTYTPGSISLNKYEPNILFIDDEEFCLSSVETMLYGTRYNLIKIKSAHFALEYLKEHGEYISIIFIDLMMPDVYGLNFISEIKNDPRLAHIPIILQTSSSDEEELAKAVYIGIFSLIRKPYNKKTLLDEIEKAMLLNKNI